MADSVTVLFKLTQALMFAGIVSAAGTFLVTGCAGSITPVTKVDGEYVRHDEVMTGRTTRGGSTRSLFWQWSYLLSGWRIYGFLGGIAVAMAALALMVRFAADSTTQE